MGKKLKKKLKTAIATVVMVVMLVTTLAACSVTDMAYMAFMREISRVEMYSFQSEYTIEIADPGEMRSFYSMLAGFSSRPGEMITVNLNFEGDVIITDDDFYMDITMRYGINNRRMPQSLNFLLKNEKIYIPVEDYIDLMLLSYRHLEGYSDRMVSNLREALRREFSGHDYVVIEDVFEELAAWISHSLMLGADMATTTSEQDEEAWQILTNAASRIFSGFGSSMTRTDGNGVTLEVNPERVLALLDNLIKHLQTNRSMIFREMLNAMRAIEATFEDGNIMKEHYRTLIFEMEDSRQDFYDAIDEIAEVFGSMNDFDRDLALLTFRGSYLRHTVSRVPNGFNERINANLTFQGERYFALRGQSTMTRANVEQRTPTVENAISLQNVDAQTNAVYNSVNPVRTMELSWWGDDTQTWLNVMRVEGRDWDWRSVALIVEDGEVYAPLRRVLERFNKEVGWDNEARAAYVLVNGEQVYIDGRMEDSVMFFNVRELEKLGFTVEIDLSEEEWFDTNRVTITRN